MDNDKINWDDYNFHFDDDDAPVRPPQPQQNIPPQSNGPFSIDALRRVHDGNNMPHTQAPMYDDSYADIYTQVSSPYDVYEDVPDYDSQNDASLTEPKPPRSKKTKKKRRFLRLLGKLLAVFLVLVLLTAAVLWFFQKMPQADVGIGTRKDGCCTVLLAGTDESGIRTDTLMVLYVDRPNKSLRLLSIPRDTMVNRDNPVPKINGAYYANGAGTVGMGYLMDYVKDLIGYRPDGYMLIDLNCFESLVNIMGGVTFDVPMDMYYADPSQDLLIDLKQGEQKLNGKEAMWLVRFRSGYAAADLQRISVQRDFLKAAMSQWGKLRNLGRVPAALVLLQKNTLTDLAWNNITWLGISVMLCGTDSFQTHTLPGDGAYVNGGAYFVEDRAAAAALINEHFNPYETEITAYDLHPYGY